MTPQDFINLIRDFDRKTNNNLNIIKDELEATPSLVANLEVLAEYSQIACKYNDLRDKVKDLDAWPIEYRPIDLKHFFIKIVLTNTAKTYFHTLVSKEYDLASARKLLDHYGDLRNTIVGESQTADGLLRKYDGVQLAGTKHAADDDVKHTGETDSGADIE